MRTALLLLASALSAQTVPPDLNGTWLISGPGYTPAYLVLARSGANLTGRIEYSGYADPVIGTVKPGQPNPNVLSIDFTEIQASGLHVIWAAYTTGPDSLQGALSIYYHQPDYKAPSPTDSDRYVGGGWTAKRFNPAPTVNPPVSPPVLTDSQKIDQLAQSVARIETAIQAVLDYLKSFPVGAVEPPQ